MIRRKHWSLRSSYNRFLGISKIYDPLLPWQRNHLDDHRYAWDARVSARQLEVELSHDDLPLKHDAHKQALSYVVISPGSPRVHEDIPVQSLQSTRKKPEPLLVECDKQMKQLITFPKSIEKGSSSKLILGKFPFIEEMRMKVLSPGVKPPTFESYADSTNPKEHLAHFYSIMQIHDYSDAIWCKLLSSTFKGATRH